MSPEERLLAIGDLIRAEEEEKQKLINAESDNGVKWVLIITTKLEMR